ncbi:MAG: type II toxin-antitoxin system PemK/MazF family toxin [Treponema sp.]|nr:type II toxin-antitoxin system PemK/MazF family toxin [Treponema sp.]
MVNKWDISFCCLDPTMGSEQRGTRPVLVISSDAVNHVLPICTVIPLSSWKQGDKIYPTEVLLPASSTGLPKDSIAMIHQIRTIAHVRLKPSTGKLENENLREQVRKVVRLYFDV